MTPLGSDHDEQTEAERLAIARRYREKRGRELCGLAEAALGHGVVAAGEFSTVPVESLAAIPLFGMLLLPYARRRSRRAGLPANLLIALDAETVHALERKLAEPMVGPPIAVPVTSWPRADVRVSAVRPRFMRSEVTLEIAGREEPVVLYAMSLTTNPWSAEVVRLLGGDAPAPIDLGEPD